MSNIIIKGVSKSFGKKLVLDNINLTIEEGKIYGLLGRNGVGKTTLLNIATAREIPTTGEVVIGNESLWENEDVLSKISFMTERNFYSGEYRVNKIFKWSRELNEKFDLEYANELSIKFGLNLKSRFDKLSTGYKTICKIIATLASGREILIFDEPILGLDANHRELFYKELITIYGKYEPTIIISTHLIGEVANILEKVVIVKESKVIFDTDVETLMESAYGISGKKEMIDQYIRDKKVLSIESMGPYSEATILENRDEINNDLVKSLSLEVNKVDLQKLFIHITEGEF